MSRRASCPPRPRRPRAATSLPEMVAVLVLTAIVLAVAVPRMRYGVERAAVRGAVADVVATLSAARQLAVSNGGGVAVSVDGPSATIRVTRHGDTVLDRP